MPRSQRLTAAVLALAAIAPVAAHAEDSRTGEIAEQLNDPMTQYAVAGMLKAMSNMLLDLEVEPFIRVLESTGARPERDLPPDATVRDLAGPRAERMQDEMVEEVPEMMGRMGDMAGALEGMIPQLEAMARRMRDALPAR